MSRPVVHFELGGPDGPALQAFYAKQFGWKVDTNNPMQYGVVPAGKSGIGGGISGAPPDGPQSWCTFYIAVPDVDAALAAIESAGGKTVVPTTVIPDMVTFAQFADPAGNVVGLVLEQEPPPAPKKKAPKRKAKKKAPKRKAKKKAPKRKAKKKAKKKAGKKKAGKKKAGRKKAAKNKKRGKKKARRR